MRSALAGLRRAPRLLVGAMLTLAVSIGVNLAMVGLIDRALLSAPSELTDAGRLFTLSFAAPGDRSGLTEMTSTSYVAFHQVRDDVPAFSGVAAFQRLSSTFMVEGDQRNIHAMLVSANYFSVLGVHAALGRVFEKEDDEAMGTGAVVLSDSYWRSRFQSDPHVLGQRVSLAGVNYIVVGVMPAGFSGHSNAAVDAWVPFAAAMSATPGWADESLRNIAGVIVRLKANEGVIAASSQATAALGRRVALASLAGVEVNPTNQKVAWWLLGVSLLVLVVGLANTATLLIVRGARGRQQMRIRMALGASRGALTRHVAAEAALVSAGALLLSLWLATAFDDTVRAVLFPTLLATAGPSTLVYRVALFVALMAIAVVTAAGASQIPSERRNISLSASQVDGRSRTRLMNGLLVTQTTLSVVLLAGAGFFGSSLYRLWAQDFGMNLDRVMVVDFEPGAAEIANQDELFSDALQRVRPVPGVQLATPIDSIPFAGFNVPPISVPGRAEPPAMGRQLPFLTAATPDFFRILGLQIVQGRALTEADDHGAPVVLVNETMARGVWPGESALGKCIRLGFDPDFNPQTFDPSHGPPMPSAAVPCREVVGVTRDVRQRSVLPTDGEDKWMQYFVPFSQVPTPSFVPNPTHIRGLLLKTTGDPTALAATIRRLVIADRADLPYLRVRPYTELLSGQMRPWNVGLRLFGLFSALALGVAAIGLYASFAHAVSERRREMAIRLAIGARPAGVRRLVLREALLLALPGVGLGGAIAVAGGRAARSLLFETTPADPVVLIGAGGVMVLVAAIATLIPAHEAAKSDPSVLLRSE